MRSTASGAEEAAPGAEMAIQVSGWIEECCTSTPVYLDPAYAYCTRRDTATPLTIGSGPSWETASSTCIIQTYVFSHHSSPHFVVELWPCELELRLEPFGRVSRSRAGRRGSLVCERQQRASALRSFYSLLKIKRILHQSMSINWSQSTHKVYP